MVISEKREIVKKYVIAREGKNQYTQSEKRVFVDDGWSDCSSLIQRAYEEIGLSIGNDTGEQILNGKWIQIGAVLPDETKMEIGDVLFFSIGYDNGRLYNVGHVEIYVGNGEISGHGCDIGPVRKDMMEYCKERNAANKAFIGVKRYIEDKVEDI